MVDFIERLVLWGGLCSFVFAVETMLVKEAKRIELSSRISETFQKPALVRSTELYETISDLFATFFSPANNSEQISIRKSFLVTSFFFLFGWGWLLLSNGNLSLLLWTSLAPVVTLLFLFFAAAVTDYFSLIQTRNFLAISAGLKSWKQSVLLVVSDVLLTLFISAVSLAFALTISLYLFKALAPQTAVLQVSLPTKELVSDSEFTGVDEASSDFAQGEVVPNPLANDITKIMMVRSSERDEWLNRLRAIKPFTTDRTAETIDTLIESYRNVLGEPFVIYQQGTRIGHNLVQATKRMPPGVIGLHFWGATTLEEFNLNCSEEIDRTFNPGTYVKVRYRGEELYQNARIEVCSRLIAGEIVDLQYKANLPILLSSFFDLWSANFDAVYMGYRNQYVSGFALKASVDLSQTARDFERATSKWVNNLEKSGADVSDRSTSISQEYLLGALLRSRYGDFASTARIPLLPYVIAGLFSTMIIWASLLGIRLYSWVYKVAKARGVLSWINEKSPISGLFFIGTVPLFLFMSLPG